MDTAPKTTAPSGDSDAMSALEPLLPSTLCAPFRAARWPTKYFVHHGSRDRLPGWMRIPALADPVDLRRLCPLADVSVSQAGVHFQALLPASASAVDLLLRFGLTLSFSNVSHAIPGARAWLDTLADELGMMRSQADVGVFVSAPHQGLVPHFDAYDAFVVQLRGKKTWRVGRSPALASPVGLQYAPGTPPNEIHGAMMGTPGLPESDPTDLDSVELEPGSVLFVPRGTWHTTTASDAVSVSASLFLSVPSIGEIFLKQLERLVAQDARLRVPAFGFAGDGQQRQRAVEIFETAAPVLAETVALLRAQAAFEASAAPDKLCDSICTSTRFLRDPSRRIDFDRSSETEDNGALQLHVVDTPRARPQEDALPDVLVMPPVAVPLLKWVLERRGTFTAETMMTAFPRFDMPSIAGLLSELVTVRVLLLLPFGPPGGDVHG